jgi:hypothetical protein
MKMDRSGMKDTIRMIRKMDFGPIGVKKAIL